MYDEDFVLKLTQRVATVGKTNRDAPRLHKVEPFRHYFSKNGTLKYDELDEYDGKFSRREIIVRYLLINAVLDQGPDMKGVRELLMNVTTGLYRQGIRILHKPIEFFKELDISIDEILSKHESIKKIRAEDWAKENRAIPSRYNLIFAQSMRGIISTKQVLDYAIHRWGVPLCVPLLLERENQKSGKISPQLLVDYLESWNSAEVMARQLKNNERYGLGSAIGDKACHLFAKWYISIFNLVKSRIKDSGWSDISYEVPFDSNAGRVLFRTGFFLKLAPLKSYEECNAIQKGMGKGGTHHIRVTNIREKKISSIPKDSEIFKDYIQLIRNYIKTGKNPRMIQIQHFPNLLIFELSKKGYEYSVADFDDGLMFIGTNYCFNHENPNCLDCPINDLCMGYREDKSLIINYRT